MMQMAWNIWTVSTTWRMWGIAIPRWASRVAVSTYTALLSACKSYTCSPQGRSLVSQLMRHTRTELGQVVLMRCALGLNVSSKADSQYTGSSVSCRMVFAGCVRHLKAAGDAQYKLQISPRGLVHVC